MRLDFVQDPFSSIQDEQEVLSTLSSFIAPEQCHATIVLHLSINKLLEAIEKFGSESQALEDSRTNRFKTISEFHSHLKLLKGRSTDECLSWISQVSAPASAEAQLAMLACHGAQYCELLLTQGAFTALQYATAHFKIYSESHRAMVQEFMSLLLLSADLRAHDPNTGLFADCIKSKYFLPSGNAQPAWDSAVRAFQVFGETCLEIPRSNPLAILSETYDFCVSSMKSLPDSAVSDSNSAVTLPESLVFHSVFVCPILRAPPAADDPAVLLKCGHCVSRSAMIRLVPASSRGSTGQITFKCPTCPVKMQASETLELVL
jgi:hypothetical protein